MSRLKKAVPRGPRRPLESSAANAPLPTPDDEAARPTLVDPPPDDATNFLESIEAPEMALAAEPAASEQVAETPDDEGARQDEPAEFTADDPIEIEHARLLPRVHLRGLLEALVFASDKPVTSHELAKMASAPLRDVKELLGELKATYAQRGIVLAEVAGGWLFRTSVQFAPFVRELTSERPVRLSRAQLETLAIAAYRQPITRPEIDEIRGVDSGATLKLLLERELLRILGKKDEPGRPLLYGTTTQFLEFFGLKSLKDLPTLREFAELSDESRRVAEAELGDVLPETRRLADAPVPAPEGAELGDVLPETRRLANEPVPPREGNDEAPPPDTVVDDASTRPSLEEVGASVDETSITDPAGVLGEKEKPRDER